MPTLFFIWLAAALALAVLSGRSSAGLPLAYFLGLSLIHVPGAIVHMDAGETDPTRLGFEQTVIGIVAFLSAVIISRAVLRFLRPGRKALAGPSEALTHHGTTALDRVALLSCLLGSFTYFVVMPFAGVIPSATAVLSSLGSLIVVGSCFRIWAAHQGGNRFKFWSTIICLPLLPLSTVVQNGFIGFGTYWVIAIVGFLFAQARWRILYICVAPVVFFVGLSLFVNYMAARDDIRKLVWYQQAGLGDRLQRVEDVFRNFEWLDFANVKQRKSIDSRLNQNFLDGEAVSSLRSGLHEYASGSTISDVIVSLIPRALWPEKPAVGGGGNVVTQYTGIRFARGTSVGAGQVLEFYVNFGTWGVVAGFLVYGAVLSAMDLMVIHNLGRGDLSRCLLVFMIGLSLLQPGGNLVEIVVAAAGAVVGAFGMNRFVLGVEAPQRRTTVAAA